MAEASKSSFLGSITSWSRSNTPPPKSPQQVPLRHDTLKQSDGADHAISLRPSPSLKRYPKDCPPLKTKWYYAVDVAKRKPFAPVSDDKTKVQPTPKKWVAFSKTDSQAIEDAFLALDKDDHSADDGKPTSTRVPVNEDYLYDVHVEKRELEPAYWIGPVYEVIRGSWFYADTSILRACDENLANQLEEGYLRAMPWRRKTHSRAPSQTRNRPSTSAVAGAVGDPKAANTGVDHLLSNTQRLFGTHMNTTVTYQDATVAYISSDTYLSRIGSSVYTSFGVQSGTKVVRGCSDIKASEVKMTEKSSGDAQAKSNLARGTNTTESVGASAKEVTAGPVSPRPSALERQLSSLAGLTESKDEAKLAEEDAQQAQEQEMEDAREKDGEDQNRRIDHLVLVTHGIGQRLGLRLDSINFVHDVNTMRKTIKGVYGSAPDLQALSGDPSNCTIQVLPICWRHMLDFPRQSLRQNRKEFDLGDMDSGLDDEYPSLQDITVEGVPAVRNLITDLAMDVLLYQSAYREHIASIVGREANRIYKLFKQRTGFQGKVSLCGHSLGSAIIFDILCRQESATTTRPRRVSSKTSRDHHHNEQSDVKLEFDCENFFALGSPIALFQMLKGRTIAGRQTLQDKAPVTSPFETPAQIDPFATGGTTASPVPITVSSPKCDELFNIFHPTDPIAYRIEPLISPAMAQLKSQPLPYVKKGLFGAPGIANVTARVGQQVMSGWYSLTSGVASTLINRSLGITGQEQALPQDRRPATATQPQPAPTIPSAPTSDTTMRINDGQKQAELARTLSNQDDAPSSTNKPSTTLIDSEIETLYSGFQKLRRQSQSSEASTSSNTANTTTAAATEPDPLNINDLTEVEKARKLRREEAKVRALNSNGRVDYHIQEGMFDVSLLASIASHLSYWADEDVNHFMIGQMLKRGLGGGSASASASTSVARSAHGSRGGSLSVTTEEEELRKKEDALT